ncbi:uncharacterized protein L969DRAFT_247592 [Mixia osmundae IAM 14324]|uniref:Uncharacterized protein n=1 Tax=Mixia osmundae (strain CBS 9802 / IAM 14324 / JCM 22182 / KY 12970) TaxID=764103 RepID=G7E1K0_MIXOS|nr:uncharacterized protein L969DRAFT_247592 [Mixia osmundae IAM 14324]KEI36662.1 hypothetical protein L969DRAFT_247592 [Mixia osmundae IAM 14324]GAA96710.1 hypothetical protein E5Q_03381 [Mixia osmundae IAM 14324]
MKSITSGIPFILTNLVRLADIVIIVLYIVASSLAYSGRIAILKEVTPSQPNTIAFVVLFALGIDVTLILCLISEMPFPRAEEMLQNALPIISAKYGSGWLGAILLIVSSETLSGTLIFHDSLFSGAAVALFVMGIINVFCGLLLGVAMNELRSVFTFDDTDGKLDKFATSEHSHSTRKLNISGPVPLSQV